MIALDSYNGTVLWGMEIPDLRRVNMPRDAGNWCADERWLYVAVKDRAWVLDAQTGERRVALALPPDRGNEYEWGYIGKSGGGVDGERPSGSLGGGDRGNEPGQERGTTGTVVLRCVIFGMTGLVGERASRSLGGRSRGAWMVTEWGTTGTVVLRCVMFGMTGW